MSIEIRQMVVNGRVQQTDAPPAESSQGEIDREQLKAEIKEICTTLIRHFFQQQKER